MNDRALRVLEQYELEVISTRRGRGVWIFETAQGLRILSAYSGSEERALFQDCVMDRIRSGGYQNIDRILPNKEGSLVSRDWEGNHYVVKEWYTGHECDTSNEVEILAAVENLACLHSLMRLNGEDFCAAGSDENQSRNHPSIPDPERFRENYTAQPPLADLRAWNAQLRKIRSFVRARPAKSTFERRFLDCFERYFAQAQEAENRLANLQDRLEDLRAERSGAVCHGDYSHHHVLIRGYEMATTSFDNCRFDFQINDLYRFMRKIMEKHDWNVRLGMRMIETYARDRTLSAAERRLLSVRLLYPEKFRKLAGSYYGSNKAWISRQYMEKLDKINRQENARQEFLKKLSL